MSLPVAIVTGAASGIGLATAQMLTAAGYQVVSCDLNSAPAVQSECERWVEHLEVDVRDVAQLEMLVERAAAYGPITCLVNNAGINMVRAVGEVTEADWAACLDTNLRAAFFASQLAVPHLAKAGGGSIINVASNAGILPRAHDPVYSISKMGLIGLTKSLALCLSPQNIRVNAVCPGPVAQTGMIERDLAQASDREAMLQKFMQASPLAKAQSRLIAPEEVAASVAYLASAAASMVTGTAIAIDGGKSLGVPPQN